MGYYSALKRDEVLIHATTWVTLENMLSEGSRSKKDHMCMIPLVRNVQNKQIYRGRKDTRGCLGAGGREEWSTRFLLGGDAGIR